MYVYIREGPPLNDNVNCIDGTAYICSGPKTLHETESILLDFDVL